MAIREINLIPADILTRRHLLRHLCLWTGCLIISLALIGGFHLYHTHVVLAKSRNPITLNDMHTRLGSRIGEIKKLQEELETLGQQQSLLETIARGQPYYRIIFKLAALVGKDTWFTQLAIDNAEDKEEEIGPSLQLTGFSLSSEELGNFINRLSGEPLFRAVILRYAKETTMAESQHDAGQPLKLIQFEVECAISRG